MLSGVKVIRNRLRSFGFDLIRYGQEDDLNKVRNQILAVVTDVVDAGANSGQWATELRRLGYRGRIHSFEPINDLFLMLENNSRDDPNWIPYHCGLGNLDQNQIIHIAANEGGSSSLLKINSFVTEVQNSTKTIGEENVSIKRLDQVDIFQEESKIFLKVDVQGFELEVLMGASAIMPLVHGLEIEVSLIEVYENQSLIEDLITLARKFDFKPVQLRKGFLNEENLHLYQIDLLFLRK